MFHVIGLCSVESYTLRVPTQHLTCSRDETTTIGPELVTQGAYRDSCCEIEGTAFDLVKDGGEGTRPKDTAFGAPKTHRIAFVNVTYIVPMYENSNYGVLVGLVGLSAQL